MVAVPGTPALTDERWARRRAAAPGAAAGQRGAARRTTTGGVLGGMLWVMRTGAAWREVPAEFGPWQTLYSRYSRWLDDGTWGSILAALLRTLRMLPRQVDRISVAGVLAKLRLKPSSAGRIAAARRNR